MPSFDSIQRDFKIVSENFGVFVPSISFSEILDKAPRGLEWPNGGDMWKILSKKIEKQIPSKIIAYKQQTKKWSEYYFSKIWFLSEKGSIISWDWTPRNNAAPYILWLYDDLPKVAQLRGNHEHQDWKHIIGTIVNPSVFENKESYVLKQTDIVSKDINSYIEFIKDKTNEKLNRLIEDNERVIKDTQELLQFFENKEKKNDDDKDDDDKDELIQYEKKLKEILKEHDAYEVVDDLDDAYMEIIRLARNNKLDLIQDEKLKKIIKKINLDDIYTDAYKVYMEISRLANKDFELDFIQDEKLKKILKEIDWDDIYTDAFNVYRDIKLYLDNFIQDEKTKKKLKKIYKEYKSDPPSEVEWDVYFEIRRLARDNKLDFKEENEEHKEIQNLLNKRKRLIKKKKDDDKDYWFFYNDFNSDEAEQRRFDVYHIIGELARNNKLDLIEHTEIKEKLEKIFKDRLNAYIRYKQKKKNKDGK